MTRRIVLLLLPLALVLSTAAPAKAQRGGGHGGMSAPHAAGGSFGAGSRGAFAPSFSRSPQFFRSPSMSGFRPAFRAPNAYRNFGYGQPMARFRSTYPEARSPRGRERGRDRSRDHGYGRPYVYAYGNYLVPNLLGYPFGFGYDPFLDSFFDDDSDQGEQGAPEQPAQQGYAPPEGYGPVQAPYPDSDQEFSDGYRQAYQGPAAEGTPGQRSPGLPPAGSGALVPQPPTTLVFQDGRPAEQVHNYVLTKTTLYDLDTDSRREIPLADLNLAATIAANRSAGIDFSVPASY